MSGTGDAATPPQREVCEFPDLQRSEVSFWPGRGPWRPPMVAMRQHLARALQSTSNRPAAQSGDQRDLVQLVIIHSSQISLDAEPSSPRTDRSTTRPRA
jgi:hypothetical protein